MASRARNNRRETAKKNNMAGLQRSTHVDRKC